MFIAKTRLVGFLLMAMAFAACAGDRADADLDLESDAPGVATSEVSYEAGGVTMNGYLAHDPSVEGRRPGVLVVHEWWGHNDYARRRAEMLAELGYTALAVDMYGDGKTADHPDDAGAFAQQVAADMDAAEARFVAALDVLKNHPSTDPERVAAIGYCFGGGVVLAMARRGLDLDGVASFHGSVAPPPTPTPPGSIKARVLVLHGGADPFVPPDQLAGFRADMDQAGAPYEVVVYENVLHSFTNPAADSVGEKFGLPLKYDAGADEQSWARLQQFFREIF